MEISLFRPKSIFNNKENNNRILLVIAHPDDEALFFSPLLLASSTYNYQLSILCLSDGDFDGHGLKRRDELIKSAAIYNIKRDNITIIIDKELLDGPSNHWPQSLIAFYVQREVNRVQPSVIVTFDSYGVSGIHIYIYRVYIRIYTLLFSKLIEPLLLIYMQAILII